MFQLILQNYPGESTRNITVQELVIDEEKARWTYSHLGAGGVASMCWRGIMQAYGIDMKAAMQVAKAAAIQIEPALRDSVRMANATLTQDDLLHAFTKFEYCSDACDHFFKYLKRCWKVYQEDRSLSSDPYVTILQSAGNGKSRLMYELAKRTSESDDMGFKVLYTCFPSPSSAAFPQPTSSLCQWFSVPSGVKADWSRTSCRCTITPKRTGVAWGKSGLSFLRTRRRMKL